MIPAFYVQKRMGCPRCSWLGSVVWVPAPATLLPARFIDEAAAHVWREHPEEAAVLTGLERAPWEEATT